MKAGYFPRDWAGTMIACGFHDGLVMGWLIVLLSTPYNIIGTIICFFLTKAGADIFTKNE